MDSLERVFLLLALIMTVSGSALLCASVWGLP